MSAATLEGALRELGVDSRVEAIGALAVIVACEPGALRDAIAREVAVRILPEHGFTHLALELLDDERDAALSRD
ncbi:MAG: hypothetical protein ACRENI_02620 [Gemmatimonadaceae bacterium]